MGAKNPTHNENYSHTCTANPVNRTDGLGDLSLVYTADEQATLYRFYIHEALTGKAEKSSSTTRSLADLGWAGTKKLNELERELLKAAGMHSFVMLGSNSIKETLKAMAFGDALCAEHPRCLLRRRTDLYLQETGVVRHDYTQNRMECLFTHLRNGFAHGLVHVFDNGNVLIEDYKDSKQTAAILVKAQTLLDWIEIVETQGKDNSK